MGSNIPTSQSYYTEWEFFMSGILWIPFAILLLYLSYEHNTKRRYPQNIIILLLALGSIVRMIWFFLYYENRAMLYEVLLNRIAILLQFSSLSILVLMWGRAVKIMPSAIKKLSNRKRNLTTPTPNEIHDEYEKRLVFYRRLVIGVNFVAWTFILASCANADNQWYAINITTLSSLCFVEAIAILVVGIHTGYKLQKEMAPVYVSSSGQPDLTKKPPSLLKFGVLFKLISFVYRSNTGNRGLQIQKQVLRSLLTTASVLSICFLIRSLIFWFTNSIKSVNITLDDICYPFFLYQVPEFIPTLILARAISPPNGILRKVMWRRVTYQQRSSRKHNVVVEVHNRMISKETLGLDSLSIMSTPSVYGSESKSSVSQYPTESFIDSSYAGNVSSNPNEIRYCGSVILQPSSNVITARNELQNTKEYRTGMRGHHDHNHDGDDDSRGNRNENERDSDSVSGASKMADAQRHWRQYDMDDELSEYSEYDIDDFVYRTTSFDSSVG